MIGIDLGTTNSLIAICDEDGPRIIANELAEDLTPSAVAVASDGSTLVGRAAKDRLVSDPDSGCAFFKRDMGTELTYTFGGRKWTPAECSAIVLQSLRMSAENYLSRPVESAVISVPAYFNDSQRQATLESARIAGIKVDRLINEPTAAALAFGYDNPDEEKQVMIFDIGGGTFDVTVLDIFERVVEVTASGGISRLGGEDYTEFYLQYLAKKYLLNTEGTNRLRLRQHIEIIKRRLGKETSFTYELGEQRIECTREDFDLATMELTQRIQPIVQRAMRDAGAAITDFDDILLVGGASRMNVISDYVLNKFGKEGNAKIDPDRVVAIGAAIQASLFRSEKTVRDMVLTDVAPHSLGIEIAKHLGARSVKGGYFEPLIDRNTTVPVSHVKMFNTMFPTQDKVSLEIYQGEHRMTAENTKIGSFTVDGLYTKDPETNGVFTVRFTYDMNGVLEVEATRLHDQHKVSNIIEERPGALTPAELKEAIIRLAPFKVQQKSLLINSALLARAERLYEDVQGEMREELTYLLDMFDAALECDDDEQIKECRSMLSQFLSQFYNEEGEQQI